MRDWMKSENSWDRTAIATLALLTLCLVLGGASREHALRLALLELAALPVLAIGLLGVWDRKLRSGRRTVLTMAAAIAALPLIQLVPLPPDLWRALPGREQGVLALEVAGVRPGWAPISVFPDATWRSFLALLPPLAVFLGALLLRRNGRRGAVWLLAGFLAGSLILGFVQIAAGGKFYAWPVGDTVAVRGLFANANHLATLCLIVLPFAAAMVGSAMRRGPDGRATLVWGAALGVIAVFGLVLIRSRAGLALGLPVILLSATLAWTAAARSETGSRVRRLGLAIGVGAVLATVAAVGLGPILTEFNPPETAEPRFERWPRVAEAAQAHLPVGAGFGSFDRIYRSVEPVAEVDETFFNRAHNDFLETWLEGGWLSVALVLVFMGWFVRRSLVAWRAPAGGDAEIRRAASIAILAVLAHSVVDYPLRTVTIAACLALCVALLEGAKEPA